MQHWFGFIINSNSSQYSQFSLIDHLWVKVIQWSIRENGMQEAVWVRVLSFWVLFFLPFLPDKMEKNEEKNECLMNAGLNPRMLITLSTHSKL